MHIARTGLDAQDMRMRVISNNLANVNTTGFKRDRAAFETLAYQTCTAPGAREHVGDQIRDRAQPRHRRARSRAPRGSTRRARCRRRATASTSRSTATAISRCRCPAAQLGYTRAGNFSRSPEGLLVTSEGYQVMPGITVPEGATAITIGTDGTVSATIPGQTEASELGQIQVASFPNGAGLQSTGDNYLVETAASGRRQPRRRRRRTAAATSARACSRRPTSTSSRSWST